MAEIKIQLRNFSTGASAHSSIIGDLDVTSSEDFPLSLTMQNFDIRDINSRSGSFSKTSSGTSILAPEEKLQP